MSLTYFSKIRNEIKNGMNLNMFDFVLIRIQNY